MQNIDTIKEPCLVLYMTTLLNPAEVTACTKNVAEAVMLPVCIWETPNENLGQDTKYQWCFCYVFAGISDIIVLMQLIPRSLYREWDYWP
jgi:hypothetical protein